MKVKTSITLSRDLLQRVDELAEQYGTRSALIEHAVQAFLAAAARRSRDARDVEILNRRARALNAEAEDVLTYQEEP
jgi:metal-responsive CopG/Arc/MetJ family transcriptional regulator